VTTKVAWEVEFIKDVLATYHRFSTD